MSAKKTQQQAGQRTPVQDAYAAFIASREAANVSPRTIGFYGDKLSPFCAWCEENDVPHVDDIKTTHIRNFILSLKARDLSPWTLHGTARAIKAFLRFCHSEGMIADVPKITMPKLPDELLPPFTAAEVGRLLDGCENDRDKAIILFLLDTGLRAAELLALDGRDIDLTTATVYVRAGKGAKDRVTFFGAKTKQALLRYWREAGKPGKDEPLWTLRRAPSGRLTIWGLTSLLRRLGKRASVADVTPHRFRRTFAVLSLRAGMDVLSLQRIMGHADLGTTRRYVRLVDDDLRAAHKRSSNPSGKGSASRPLKSRMRTFVSIRKGVACISPTRCARAAARPPDRRHHERW